MIQGEGERGARAPFDQRDPQTRQKYREEMKRAGEDPVLAKKFLMRTSLIECLRDAGRVQ